MVFAAWEIGICLAEVLMEEYDTLFVSQEALPRVCSCAVPAVCISQLTGDLQLHMWIFMVNALV